MYQFSLLITVILFRKARWLGNLSKKSLRPLSIIHVSVLLFILTVCILTNRIMSTSTQKSTLTTKNIYTSNQISTLTTRNISTSTQKSTLTTKTYPLQIKYPL